MPKSQLPMFVSYGFRTVARAMKLLKLTPVYNASNVLSASWRSSPFAGPKTAGIGNSTAAASRSAMSAARVASTSLPVSGATGVSFNAALRVAMRLSRVAAAGSMSAVSVEWRDGSVFDFGGGDDCYLCAGGH